MGLDCMQHYLDCASARIVFHKLRIHSPLSFLDVVFGSDFRNSLLLRSPVSSFGHFNKVLSPGKASNFKWPNLSSLVPTRALSVLIRNIWT